VNGRELDEQVPAEQVWVWQDALRDALLRRPGVTYLSQLRPTVTPFGVMLRDPVGELLADMEAEGL